MSIYLWHMTALLLVLLICAPIGLSEESPSLSHWWIERPIWLAAGVVVLSGVIKVVGAAERLR